MEPTPTERLIEYLARYGQTLNPAARRVVEAAVARYGTFSWDDVYADFRGKVSRPTVYRTLSRMVEAGILRAVQFNRHTVLVLAVPEE